MDREVNIAIVGLGYWGPNRLRALNEIPGVRVGWICDRQIDRLEHFAGRYPDSRTTTEITEILADPDVDAVVLATPVFSHHPLGIQVIAAGKHVFIEKPLAASSGEARDLLARAEDAGVRLMCGHTFLYSPPVRAIKDIIDNGELGEIHFISSSRVNLGPYRSDVSVVFDLGPHDFSILRYWLGAEPESLSAVGRDVISDGVADVSFIDLHYPGGLLAHVELSWLAPSKLRRTVIVGSEKMLVYEDGTPEPVRLYDTGIEYSDPHDYGEYQLSYRTGDIVSLRVASTEPILAELEDFVASITLGTDPVSDGGIALDVLRTVEAAEASMRERGLRVELLGAALDGVPSSN
jgi:predicted dehydrogenase